MSTPKTICIRDLRAPVAEAIAKVQANSDFSEELKAYLVSKINRCGFAGVIVHAHETFSGGEIHLHASITKLF